MARDPKGNAPAYHFDGEARQSKAADVLRHEQSRERNANATFKATTDGLNSTSKNTYDPLNNLIDTELPTGAKNTIGYTAATHPRTRRRP
ncbi:hypothetical protein ALI144C_13915 [Actinosynnema sp. ALI-1.44]|uniref:hypothetical protein n=1 Tax=Actinosynnema sp. ALI-1.44 TaxID=1933779 RepID=UPI00097C68FD|nr:hypothetical protein [Actinosynnema sp. ALI-1.44]ONI85374.1 hypothetical protein ALI144C_13915 [Actinosynnema sp. ALI-1.44]